MDPESAVAKQAAAGSGRAFDELILRYQQRLFTLGCCLTGDPRDAEDLAQDIFLEVLDRIGTFSDHDPFRIWIYRVAVNTIRARSAHGHADWSAKRARRTDGPDAEDGKAVSDVTYRTAIDEALAELPILVRLLVVLRDVQGFTFDEVAAITDLTVESVTSEVFLARRRLRSRLESLLENTGFREARNPVSLLLR